MPLRELRQRGDRRVERQRRVQHPHLVDLARFFVVLDGKLPARFEAVG
ncbi:hypothetical protein WJ970_33365 [Achromobacter xylosoxidans]